ncbi:tyrosine-type recombinase/integrase [Paraburkholderia sp. NPDC080076]|uniref:tyrosine-type recombinase/integrase n=1 Tax=Paraburkholderia sp. NPDC080076 TaxID=3390605 RepID=UPI003D093BA0
MERVTGRVLTVSAEALPLPTWPDGHWCGEVALFIREAAAKNLSVLERGGTLGTLASLLSHVIRFSWVNKISLVKFDNDVFTKFMESLSVEKVYVQGELQEKRGGSQCQKIGKLTLNFLEFVGKLHRVDMVSERGPNIRAERRVSVAKGKHQAPGLARAYWYHASFPKKSGKKKRFLISLDYINKLRRAAAKLKAKPFVKQRLLVTIQLLESFGARNVELVRLKTKDILAAIEDKTRYVRIFNAKRRTGSEVDRTRFVKISASDLQFFKTYISIYRAPLVRKKLGAEADHGFMLVSWRTGRPLAAGTLTADLRRLRVAAGIKGKAHPHLFRHRYVTLKLLELIKAHNLTDKTGFKANFKIPAFAREVAESTGHTSIASLETYIDWAFVLLRTSSGARKEVDLGELLKSAVSAKSVLEAKRKILSDKEFGDEVLLILQAVIAEINQVDTAAKDAAGAQTIDDILGQMS